MNRRTFIETSATGAAAFAISRAYGEPRGRQQGSVRPFNLKYAPHFGMFRHHAGEDLVDQLKFAADEGFTAWEDNGMMGRPIVEQTRIARAMEELNMTMGVFVAAPKCAWIQSLATDDPSVIESFLDELRAAVEVAKRVNARWMTVVPGQLNPRVDLGFQTANAIEALRRGAEVFEPHGLVMVLEPLNPRDHPGMFLTKIAQAYEICRAVNSPAVKILDDLYHQQITEGNLIPNMDRAWDEIAYFQVGDNPGRNEPTTGEINYRNIFRHLHGKGFDGIVGMEHGVSGSGREGERTLIDAYRRVDSFAN